MLLSCAALFVFYNLIDYGVAALGNGTPYKFALVCITATTSVVYLAADNKPRTGSLLLSLALWFTIAADVFLLVLDDHYELGMVFFLLAQTFHFLRLYVLTGKRYAHLVISLGARIGLGMGVWIVTAATGQATPLIVLTGFYAAGLLANAIEPLIFFIKRKADRVGLMLLFVGFLLFIGCDVNVGLKFIGQGDYRLIWLFYGPSQMLICLSGYRFYEKQS